MSVSSKERAEKIYKDLCLKIKDNNWKYSREDEKFRVSFSVDGKDSIMNFRIRVDEESQRIKLLSHIPINVSPQKNEDIALAICAANNRIIDGNFDYDTKSRIVFFRMTNSFNDLEVKEDVLDYMLECSFFVVDKYDTLLRALSDGLMNVDEFIKIIYQLPSEFEKEDAYKKENALKIYGFIKNCLSNNGFGIQAVGELGLKFTVVGDDLNIPIIINIDSERELFRLYSPMLFAIKGGKRKQCAIDVCNANFGMDDGCFEYDSINNRLAFRTEVSYSNSKMNEDFLWYILKDACEKIDKYNHIFLIYGE